jgi:hypothetical protein
VHAFCTFLGFFGQFSVKKCFLLFFVFSCRQDMKAHIYSNPLLKDGAGLMVVFDEISIS